VALARHSGVVDAAGDSRRHRRHAARGHLVQLQSAKDVLLATIRIVPNDVAWPKNSGEPPIVAPFGSATKVVLRFMRPVSSGPARCAMQDQRGPKPAVLNSGNDNLTDRLAAATSTSTASGLRLQGARVTNTSVAPRLFRGDATITSLSS